MSGVCVCVFVVSVCAVTVFLACARHKRGVCAAYALCVCGVQSVCVRVSVVAQ